MTALSPIAAASPAPRVTRSQRQLLELLAAGLTLEQMAERVGIAPATCYEGLRRVRRNLGARTSAHLLGLAVIHGLVDPSILLSAAEAQRREMSQ